MNIFKQFYIILFFLYLISFGMIMACNDDTGPETMDNKVVQNVLTEEEKAENWILMFDGQTTEGWRGYNRNELPQGWVVEEGTLHCTGEGGDIIYDRKFLGFHLKMDWKISREGNSGIFYLVQELEGKKIWHSAPEFQILDDDTHPNVNPEQVASALYDLVPPSIETTRPAGEWNTAEIILKDGYITHRQNGREVVHIRMGTPRWNALVDESKFPVETFAKLVPGYMGVQDHGDEVWFRNIKIREL